MADRFEVGTLERRLEFPPLQWEIAADDTSLQPLATDFGEDPTRFKSGSPSHVHGEAWVAGQLVHVDCVAARCFGPGASYVELRVHVDGRLAGVGSRGGCALGFGLGWPRDAAAVIDDGHAIIVRDVRVGPERDAVSARFAVELWRWKGRV